jgi:tetratricopeptide (TPR) repeat protein
MANTQQEMPNSNFANAYQDWDIKLLEEDLTQIAKMTPAQKRNLLAIILGISPRIAARSLSLSESSLKPAFSALYRLLEKLTNQPTNTVTYKNAPLVLSKYRKGQGSFSNVTVNNLSISQHPLINQIACAPNHIQKLTTLEFIGRDRDHTNLANLSRQAKIVLIKAGAGVGKSTLAREFLQTQFKKVIRIEMGLESGNVTPAEEKVSQILRKDFDEEPSRDFGINLDILREKLADRTNPIGVLIDNLEPALDENYRFREKLRGYDALLAVLGDRDVFSFTLITSRRSLIATRAKVQEYSLEGLDITAWRQYFHDCENGTDSEALEQMRNAYNGNAKVMDILHGAIKNRFDGNIGAYWNRYKDALLADSELETLISVEMDWLRDNQPDAYKLLCRMGCYRYQDVKTVPFEGLICLLWDVAESRQAWVVDYLSKSSLIEVNEEYYLHPAVRDVANLQLKENEIDWEKSNLEAAKSFANSFQNNGAENLWILLEAFEHYLVLERQEEIDSIIISLSSEIIDKILAMGFGYILSKYLKSAKDDLIRVHWATSLYYRSDYKSAIAILSIIQEGCKSHETQRLASLKLCACYVDIGEFRKVIEIGNKLIAEIEQLKFNESIHLLNLIGDAHRCLGDFTNSINKHKLALEIAIKNNDFPYTAYSKAYVAYCKFSQMEFFKGFEKNKDSDIVDILKDVISAFQQIGDISSEVLSSCYLAKLYSYTKEPILAKKYYKSSNTVYQELSKNTHFKSPYLQNVLFNTSARLSFMTGDFNETISSLYQSIDLCKKMGTKFLLAESYFQLGLTYQAMGEHDQAEEYKAKALELFEQMEAPKQIERVNKAFGGNIQ